MLYPSTSLDSPSDSSMLINPYPPSRAPAPEAPSSQTFSKLGFALLIIGSLATLGCGIAGLGAHQGWWHAGALSNLGQVNSIIMITVGGLAAGILTMVICRKASSNVAPAELPHQGPLDVPYVPSSPSMSAANWRQQVSSYQSNYIHFSDNTTPSTHTETSKPQTRNRRPADTNFLDPRTPPFHGSSARSPSPQITQNDESPPPHMARLTPQAPESLIDLDDDPWQGDLVPLLDPNHVPPPFRPSTTPSSFPSLK